MKQSTKDNAAGKLQEIAGKLKEKAGQVSNNPDLCSSRRHRTSRELHAFRINAVSGER